MATLRLPLEDRGRKMQHLDDPLPDRSTGVRTENGSSLLSPWA
jgi:hypothetical protein